MIDLREEINRRILSTRSERIKNQQRKTYAEKDREVKRSIKSEEKMDQRTIPSSAEETAKIKQQHMRILYNLTKAICNERPRSSTAVLDNNGDFVSGKDEVQARWTEQRDTKIEMNHQAR